jgi:hypothetical protein
MTDCIFEGAKVALALNSISGWVVQDCEFRGNRIGVQIVDGQRISVTGSFFHENEIGVGMQSSREIEVTKSVLNRNDVSIRLIDTDAQVHLSNLTKNRIAVEIRSEQPVQLRENNIADNEIGVRVVRGTVDIGKLPDELGHKNLAVEVPPSAPIFAAGNYWGKLTPTQIDQTIRDDDEAPGLPPVQFDPVLERMGQTDLRVEIIDVGSDAPDGSAEGLTDSWTRIQNGVGRSDEIDGRVFREIIVLDDQGNKRMITDIGAQNIWTGGTDCWWPIYQVHLRSVNLSTQAAGPFTIELHLTADPQQEPVTDLGGSSAQLSIPSHRIGEEIRFELYYRPPDLAIDGLSQAFYLWPRIVFEGTGESRDLSGKWITFYEELPDFVGRIHEIPESAMQGETLNVRYSIKNYGRQAEGSQTVRFYLSKTLKRSSPPKPDYPLLPEIKPPELEGEWTAKLTVPADVPSGNYYLWMLVDADNDIIECNSSNNPATYLANPIRIGIIEEAEKPRAVQPDGKRPIVWGVLKTALFQNFPNPFNPETWIPYQLAGETPVHITIYNVHGQLVRRIDIGILPAGRYIDKGRAAYWDGRNERGEVVSSGIYWYQLQTADSQNTNRMVIRK